VGYGKHHGRWPHDHGWRSDYDRWGRQDRDGDPNTHRHIDPRLYGEWYGKACDPQVGYHPKRP